MISIIGWIWTALTALTLSTALNEPPVAAANNTVLPPAQHYFERTKSHAKWRSFPLKIYFTRDASYTNERAGIAQNGFSLWTEATNGFVAFQVTDSPDKAQITVRFDPSTNDGYTTTRFGRGRISTASIAVGVKYGLARDVACIAAHEFGHALGLDGHSDQGSDLMFPVHHMRARWGITQRDLNTLAIAYSATSLAIDWKPRSG